MRYYYYKNAFSDQQDLGQLSNFLQNYKLTQYLEIFVSEGFDRLSSLLDITESDLVSLRVKRGHRRLLQRAIASARGIPLSTPIVVHYGYDEPAGTATTTTTTTLVACNDEDLGSDDNDTCSYRRNRHPRRKQHVPSKPVTAFDELINEVQLQNSRMALTDITAIAFERWNRLSGIEKEKYEGQALHANSDYVMNNGNGCPSYSGDCDSSTCSIDHSLFPSFHQHV